MNWVLILVIAILAGYTIAGYTKGFLKIVYSLISWILILVVVTVASPQIENYLKNNTGIYEKVVEHCEENIREKTLRQLEKEEGKGVTTLTDNELLAKLMERLPAEAIEKVMGEASDAADRFMEEQGVYSALAISAADLIMRGISFLLSLILGVIVSILIQKLLGFISKLPLIGFADSICGLAAGAISGLILVWVLLFLVALMSTTNFGSTVISYIYENDLLIWLYENNILISIFM